MRLFRNPKQYNKSSVGDTIVEVLIAIAVASFAIGTSYSIANKSLGRAINARERNEAINILESQIAALKIRYKADKVAFNSDSLTRGFVVSSAATPTTFPYTDFHFCLNENSAGPTDPDPTHPWPRQINNFASPADANNLADTSSGGKYNPQCKKQGSTDYFVDISAQVTSTSQNLTNRTVYKITVQWPEVSTGVNGSATVYYRF